MKITKFPISPDFLASPLKKTPNYNSEALKPGILGKEGLLLKAASQPKKLTILCSEIKNETYTLIEFLIR